MSYNVLTIPPFDDQLKRLVKKYPSLKKEFAALVTSLEITPKQGTAIGNNCFKIRIAIASKGSGKRGGGRIITNIVVSDETVYLLAVYDKSEKNTVTEKELFALLNRIQ
jgi:mRNA-degrading endonuclease RelE of RelBE toxin-antitoxin system